MTIGVTISHEEVLEDTTATGMVVLHAKMLGFLTAAISL
jgi:hypothetical protein